MSYYAEWTEEYRSADGRITVTLRVESALGDKDTYLTLRCRGGAYQQTDPTIRGMAVSRDLKRLYLQECHQGKRRRTTIDLGTRKPIELEPHPSSWDDIVLLSDFVPDTGDGSSWACSPPFVLTEAADYGRDALSDGQRMTALQKACKQEPSAEAWLEVMAILRHWTGPAVRRGIDLASRLVADWPRAIRRKPAWLGWHEFHAVWRLVTYEPPELVIRRVPMGDEGAAELASSHLLGGVRRLVLTDCKIGPRGVDSITGSGRIHHLQELNLARNPIGDEGALAIASSPYLPAVKALDLRRCDLGPEGLRSLAAASGLRSLERLDLAGNPIGDEGLRALLSSPTIWRVVRLGLSKCAIGIDGIRALAEAKNLLWLRRLDLTGNPLSAKALGLLESAPSLHRRKYQYGSTCIIRHDVGGELQKLKVQRKYRWRPPEQTVQ
jgi:hypothetical protein